MLNIRRRNQVLFFGILLLVAAGLLYYLRPDITGREDGRPSGGISGEPETTPSGNNSTGLPLKVPDGFSVEVFAKDLPGARVIQFDSFGNMWVSQTSEGVISLLEVKDGRVVRQDAVLNNLRKPHGLVFDPDFETLLYYAEEDKVSNIPTYSDGAPQKMFDLPAGGSHFTRTLGIGPDGRLYVSIGSSCNVCDEQDNRRAKIFSAKTDGTDLREFARGLRNAVFFTWHPATKKMWATEMGRDMLGDDNPPDELNVVEEGKNYGWPICYGKNIHDDIFDKNTYIRNPCMEPLEMPSFADLQAHSAPLGLAFVSPPEDAQRPSGWPDEYRNDLIVAYHGSWNRTVPTGYKLVRIKLDRAGNYAGTEDFITGWLTGREVLGRPVDIKFGPDGGLYVSDDKRGVIYRITYN